MKETDSSPKTLALRRRPPEKIDFTLKAPFDPTGDQPDAIEGLDNWLRKGKRAQTLLGVTGSGKTFTIANVIAKQNRPTLIIAPNKTLAAQLYGEFKEFFPDNRVRYFVSYYDYYQPEAYIPSTDTFIEKDASINQEIDKMRHSSTRAVLEGTDTIVVASVSCIYGLGAPEDYFDMMLFVEEGDIIPREELLRKLVEMQYRRSDYEFERGNFRVRGETIDIFPSDQDSAAIRLLFFGDEVEEVREIDSVTGRTIRSLSRAAIYPLSHFVTGPENVTRAAVTVRKELKEWLPVLKNKGKLLEAERLQQRTLYDLELFKEVGFCPGIENYSRHLMGRNEGEPPTTLLDYFPEDFLLVIDESHITISQIGGMFKGDRARKQNLVEFGFRLPSALDNRPLNPDEFWERVQQVIFTSATPGDFEMEVSGDAVVEQFNRPTGVLDPEVIIRPAENQVDDLLGEIKETVSKNERVLVTTLTKKMAENLSDYFRETGIRSRYLHSDIDTLERVEILRGLRRGDFDVLIGINLLREGLDLIEVSLVAVLDADKEGFLRSTRSLIQVMGRAARNINGRSILYADKMTRSMQAAIDETDRRREIQKSFNKKYGIIPASAKSRIQPALTAEVEDMGSVNLSGSQIEIPARPDEQKKLLEKLRKEMYEYASSKEFEKAAEVRDAINEIEEKVLMQ